MRAHQKADYDCTPHFLCTPAPAARHFLGEISDARSFPFQPVLQDIQRNRGIQSFKTVFIFRKLKECKDTLMLHNKILAGLS